MAKAFALIVGAAMATIYSYSVAPEVLALWHHASSVLAIVTQK